MNRLRELWNKDTLLLQTVYNKIDDLLYVTLKNVHTKEKRIVTLTEPYVPVYIAKNTVSITTHKENIHIDDADVFYVKYRWRQWEIATILGITDFNKKIKDGTMNPDDIYLNRRVFLGDVAIEELVMRDYISTFIVKTDDGLFEVNYPIIDKFHIGALDIETDINVSEDRNLQPITAITYIDDETLKGYTVCLINDQYKGQKEIIKNIDAFKVRLKTAFIETCENINIEEDDPKKKKNKETTMKKMMLDMIEQLDMTIRFTNEEKDMIEDVNRYVFEEVNPDFLYIYNAVYDIEHQRMRSEQLGIHFEGLFKYKSLEPYAYFNNKDNSINPAKRIHQYYTANPTKILDQALVYYQLRRATEFTKWTLDATVQRETGRGKLDYSHICNYIGDLPYVDYETYLIYNIMDVFVMLLLDRATNDTYAQVYTRYNLASEWNNIGRPLPRTTSVFDLFSTLQGYIPANENNKLLLGLSDKKVDNIAKMNPQLHKMIVQLQSANVEKASDNPFQIKGGLVTSPNLINHAVKPYDEVYKIPVKTYNKMENCIDADAIGMYPSNTIANNGSKSTLIGIMNAIDGIGNPDLPQRLALSIINNNLTSIGNLFFNLPSASELIEDYFKLDVNYKNRSSLNEHFIDGDIPVPITKESKALTSFFNKRYGTTYEEKDVEAGAPSRNKLIFSSSTKEVVFSYNGTKVELTLNNASSFNELLGIEDKGFICGAYSAKDNLIINHNLEYIEFLLPTVEKFTLSECKWDKEMSETDRSRLSKAKVLAAEFIFGEYALNLIEKIIFLDLTQPVFYEVYDIIEDSNLSQVRLKQNIKLYKDITIDITQYIILYKH